MPPKLQIHTPVERIKALHAEDKLPIIIRGRAFGLRDLRIVLQCLEAHADEGRTRASEAICEQLDWKQPNGWLKDRACRDALRKLEALGLATLPAMRADVRPYHKEKKRYKPKALAAWDLETPIVALPNEIELDLAKSTASERVWNYLVDEHHYRGHKVAVGRSLKYLVRSGTRVLGAIAFSSPVWRVHARDEVLAKLGFTVATIHERVINNSRFLILPGVRVDHLASRVLSLATQRVVEDWAWYYSVEPWMAETFVEPSRFNGACYKAANWVEVGTTRGYAKTGGSHHNSQEPKQLFLYGLNRIMRAKLFTISSSGAGA